MCFFLNTLYVHNKDTLKSVHEISGAAISVRGTYFPPGRVPKVGERKLHILIEAKTQKSVDVAKIELARALREITSDVDPRSLGSTGRYKI